MKNQNKSSRRNSGKRSKKQDVRSERAIDLVDILLRRKTLLIASGIVGAVLGLTYKLFAPAKYESAAEILLTQNTSLGDSENLAGDSMSDDLLATHMKVIQSSRIVGEALGNSRALIAAQKEREAQEASEALESFNNEFGAPGLDESGLPADDGFGSDDSFGSSAEDLDDSAVPANSVDESTATESSPATVPVSTQVDLATDSDSDQDSSETETADLGSDSTEEPEVADKSLTEFPSGSELTELVLDRDLVEHPSLVAAAGEGSPSRYVIDNLYVTRGGSGAASGANTLTLKFRHKDPEITQMVLNAILAEYQVYVESKFRDINKEALDLINQARIELEDEIDVARDEYKSFLKSAPLLTGSETGTNIHATNYEERAAELTMVINEIDQAVSRITHVEETLTRLEEAGAHELEKLALIDDSNATRLGILVAVERGEARTAAFQALQPERMAEASTEYTSLLTLQAELSKAEQIKGPQHPEVLALKNQIVETKAFLEERGEKLEVTDDQEPLLPDDVMKAYVGMLKNDLIGMRQNKIDIEKQMDDAESKAKELLSYELENEDLVRRMLRAEDLYSSVVERIRDLNLKKDATPLILDVLEKPQVGEQVSPSLAVAAAITILSSMLLAGAAILLAELQDKTIHNEAELEDIFEAPVLSHLPDFSAEPTAKRLMRSVKRNGAAVHPSILTFHDPKSIVSESFRGIRTKLLMSTGSTEKLIAFTSPNQGDGKSTVIANMAVSLASTGKKTILVDCDLRRSNQHKIFHLENEVGLAEVLQGRAKLKDAIETEQVPNLTILPSGEVPDNPAELLESPQFEEFLDNVSEDYDIVLVDCPPLLPVADPAIIAAHVDHVVLVVTVNSRSQPEAEHCRKTLESSGASISGVIVNRTDVNSTTYRYGQYGYESPYQVQNNGFETSSK